MLPDPREFLGDFSGDAFGPFAAISRMTAKKIIATARTRIPDRLQRGVHPQVENDRA
jgi:hypothetical protein